MLPTADGKRKRFPSSDLADAWPPVSPAGSVVATGYNDDGQCGVSGWTNMKLPKDNLK